MDIVMTRKAFTEQRYGYGFGGDMFNTEKAVRCFFNQYPKATMLFRLLPPSSGLYRDAIGNIDGKQERVRVYDR